MEHLEIVDPRSNQPIGLKSRPEVIEQGHWSRSTNIFVLNGEGQILCHQRSKSKDRFPGVWSTHFGGHVGHGESYEVNALKELEEESGVGVQPNDMVAWRTTMIPRANLWVREFVTVIDKPAEAFTPQAEEVEQFAWKHLYEILHAHNQDPKSWFAGTHDFVTEYHCMRAVLAATWPKQFLTWHPIQP